MISITRNGRTYTGLYAWYPVRTDSGSWIWFGRYYIRPDRVTGYGIVLDHSEMLADSTPLS